MTRDLLSQAYSALKHNRRRSTLTMLGMACGIATVVILLAYGAGFERAIMTFFSGMGSNLIGVFPGRTSLQAGGAKAGTQVRFTLDDIDYLSAEVPLLKRVAPFVEKNDATIGYDIRSLQTPVDGVYPAFLQIRNMNADDGRVLNQEDQMTHARVAVIGTNIRRKLFSGRPAVGEKIHINGLSYQVIGVLKSKTDGGGDHSDNDAVLVPFSTMDDLTDTHYLDGIFMEYEGSNNEAVVNGIRQCLGAHHGFKPEDKRAIEMWNLMHDVQQFSVVTAGIKILMAFIGTLTLGIGGVGLMNIMLVSVTQRTREIGVEKALGARKRHILFQFLSEALAITAAGGLLGIIMAYLISFTVGALPLFSAIQAGNTDADIRLHIAPSTLLIATVILGFVGIVSGMLPAIKAARMNPIEALRYE